MDTFEQFYSFQDEEFKKRVPVMTMKEFIEREGKQTLSLNEDDYTRLMKLSTSCQNRRKSERCKWIVCHILRNSHLRVLFRTRRDLLRRNLREDCCTLEDESSASRNELQTRLMFDFRRECSKEWNWNSNARNQVVLRRKSCASILYPISIYLFSQIALVIHMVDAQACILHTRSRGPRNNSLRII